MEAVNREMVSIEELKEDRDRRIETLRSEIDQLLSKLNLSEIVNSELKVENAYKK
jgi:hypothetical protein